METSSPKRDFFEKPSAGSVVVFLVILALVMGFGLFRQHQIAAKLEAAQRVQAQANNQAYRDGVEQEAAKDLRRLDIPESEVIDSAVSLFRQSGATESEIEALKKRLSSMGSEKK
jgi:uncharacterized protein HemX